MTLIYLANSLMLSQPRLARGDANYGVATSPSRRRQQLVWFLRWHGPARPRFLQA
jgi:hypothetical protein